LWVGVCHRNSFVEIKGKNVRTISLRAIRLAFLPILLAVFTMAFSGTAFAQNTAAKAIHPGVTSATTSCQNLEVHLYGTLPAKTTCLVASTAGGITPDTTIASCSTIDALWLYWNANESGAEICFIGYGWANLTDWASCNAVACYNWNDQTSSFITGCAPVDFFTDINGGGSQVDAVAFERRNFPLGSVGNDTLSSVHLLSSCT
jgi:hypothetical protein